MTDPKLTPAEYWHWRTCIAEMQLAESNYKNADLRHGQMLRDIEISRLHALMFQKVNMNQLDEQHTLCKREYEKCKSNLEESLGVSLNGCVIDDVDFSVKKLEE